MFQLVCSHLCFVFVQKSCLKNVIHFLCNQFKSSQPKLCSWKYLIYLFICCCFVQLNWIYYVLLLLLHRPSYLVSFAKWNQVPFLYVFDCAQANLFYCIHLNTFDSAFFYIYIYFSHFVLSSMLFSLFLFLRRRTCTCCWACFFWASGVSSFWLAVFTGWATNLQTSPTRTTLQPIVPVSWLER